MESYMKLKKMLCRELDYIVSKGELNPRDLEFVDKITHSIASLLKIMKMEGGEMSEYSGNGMRGSYDNYSRGYGYDNSYGDNGYGNNYDYGMSGRRDSMGRFAPMTRGYSRDESKTQMLDHLDKMMDDATNKDEREMIQRIYNELKTL